MSSVKIMDSDILQNFMQNYLQKSTIRVTTLIAYQNEIQMLGLSRRLNKLMLYYRKNNIITKCINDNNNIMKLV